MPSCAEDSFQSMGQQVASVEHCLQCLPQVSSFVVFRDGMLSRSPVALGKQVSCGSRLAKSFLWQDLYLWHTPELQI